MHLSYSCCLFQGFLNPPRDLLCLLALTCDTLLGPGSTGKPKGICVQHCGVANVIAHKLGELERAGITAGDKMLNWMALNFGESSVIAHELQTGAVSSCTGLHSTTRAQHS